MNSIMSYYAYIKWPTKFLICKNLITSLTNGNSQAEDLSSGRGATQDLLNQNLETGSGTGGF